ncbi:hypothetical protein HELRODRAFT_164552 [Helobdella robusta]|uniref:Uncharacterized protein n=1 Tax=Helobdella robusta TaxID=6412 RepID=T1EVK5_HELRO|nr:hypothetical protein HELRODRAFT_164552 [Helobdella robusta]ESN94669.1 hypothetical protein HELRODRAFT_164552 [Helobdella robusta]
MTHGRSSCILTVSLSQDFFSQRSSSTAKLPWRGRVTVFSFGQLKVINVEVLDRIAAEVALPTATTQHKIVATDRNNTLIPIHLVNVSLLPSSSSSSSSSWSSVEFHSESENIYRLSVTVDQINRPLEVKLLITGLTLFIASWTLYHVSPIVLTKFVNNLCSCHFLKDGENKEMKEFVYDVFKSSYNKGFIENNSHNTLTFRMQAPSRHLFMQRWEMKVETSGYVQVIVLDLSLEVKGWMSNKGKSMLMSEVSVCNMKPTRSAVDTKDDAALFDVGHNSANDGKRFADVNLRNSTFQNDAAKKGSSFTSSNQQLSNRREVRVFPTELTYQVDEINKTFVKKFDIQNWTRTTVQFSVIKFPMAPFSFDRTEFKIESISITNLSMKCASYVILISPFNQYYEMYEDLKWF